MPTTDSGRRMAALTVIGALALIYALICAAVFVGQRSLIYFPQPSSLGSRDTTVVLPVADAHVVASVRHRPGPHAVVYFGGNGEDVTRTIPELAAAFPEHALYLLHYRSYGGSSGTPSETALVADALALFDVAQREHRSVEVVGRSLGSGIAVHVASVRPAARLVLVTPYDSLQEIAIEHFPWLPARWLLRDKYESWRYAPRITAPTLLIAAENDEVIPRQSTERLLSRFKAGVAALEVVPQADHNSVSNQPDYGPLLGGAPAASAAAAVSGREPGAWRGTSSRE